MIDLELFSRFATALGLGLLIGLQRESAAREGEEHALFAGVRTFSLLALLGSASAYWAAEVGFPGLVALPILLAGALVVAVYVITALRGEAGMTTEVAALLTLVLGVLCIHAELLVAVGLGVTTMALLSLKVELHQLAGRVTREDSLAVLKFGVITAIILPVLPNRTYGPAPFDVLNPSKIWWMVVLISAISFAGYLAIKWVGANRGISLTGFLGGLVSSTAVTLSFTQRSRSQKGLTAALAVAILIAWITMFIRVLVEVLVVNRELLKALWPPMLAAVAAGLFCALILYFRREPEEGESIEFHNPFELGPAVKFGLLYGVVLLVSRSAQLWFGEAGVYLSSVVAGLTDVDAVTLSMAELSRTDGELETVVAARAVILATLSNTMVKGGIVMVGGSSSLRRALTPGFVAILAASLLVAFLR